MTDDDVPGPPSGLTEPARRLVEVAAVLGSTFTLDDSATVLGVPTGSLLSPLDELLISGSVKRTAAALEFSSENSRTVVYLSLPLSIRIGLHRQIGRMYYERGGSAAAAAGHLLTHPQSGDREMLGWLDHVVEETSSSMPQLAADVAERAFDLTEEVDELRYARAAIAVKALTSAGRLSASLSVAQSLLRLPDLPPAIAAELRLVVASIYFATGRTREAESEASLVLGEPSLPMRLYTRAELIQIRVLLSAEDFNHAQTRAESILAGGRPDDEGGSLAGATTALGYVAWNEGRVLPAIGLLRAAIRRGDRGPLEARTIYPRLALARRLIALGEFEQAGSLIDQAEHEIALVGDMMWESTPWILRGAALLGLGRLPKAEELAQHGLVLAERMGAHFFEVTARFFVASTALARGDMTRCLDELAIIRRAAGSGYGLVGSDSITLLQARADVANRQDPGASLDALYADPYSHRRILLDEPMAASWLVRTALKRGLTDTARRVAETAQRLVQDNPTFRSLSAVSEHARGLLEADADSVLQASLGYSQPMLVASAEEDAAMILAKHGDRAAAIPHFDRAYVLYQRAGAEHDHSRVQSRLRSIGVHRRRWKPTERPLLGWESLTEAEERVASLVVEGLSNADVADRLYISPHTVDSHLRQVYQKLDIHSRVELTRLAVGRKTDS